MSHLANDSIINENSAKKLIYENFRIPLRLTQSLAGLLYLALIIKFDTMSDSALNSTKGSYKNPLYIIVLIEGIVHRFHLAMGFLSFILGSIFAEYNEKDRKFSFYKFKKLENYSTSKTLADVIFPVGLPEGISIILTGFWAFNAITTTFVLPNIDINFMKGNIEKVPNIYHQSLYEVFIEGLRLSEISFAPLFKYVIPFITCINHLLWLISSLLIVHDLSG